MDPGELRSVFISDVHLGTRDAQSDRLLDFLGRVNPDYLYLVGDILDFWKMRTGWYWPPTNNRIVQTVIALVSNGTRVVFIPGNHDESLRDYTGSEWSGIALKRNAIHCGADGRRYLVLHGDEFDSVVIHRKWVAYLGGETYNALLLLNRWLNYGRRRLGFGYWSLAAFLKHKVKNAAKYISSFEEAVAREANRKEVDGVICGHIHKAEISRIHGVTYGNCGDWVESCTALVEHPDGGLELLDWTGDPDKLVDLRDRKEQDLCA